MKRYKMNEAREGINQSSTGIRWAYRGKFESIEDAIAEAKKWNSVVGVRVTDCETNEIVHEERW